MAAKGTYDRAKIAGYTNDIISERFRLTPLREDHEAGFWHIRSDPDVVRYLPYQVATDRAQHKQAFLTDLVEKGRYKFGWAIEWRDASKGDDIPFIGWTILRPTEDGRWIELGYTLRKPFWGLGIATEINDAIVKYAENTLLYPKEDLMASVEVGHPASRRVLEKSGFKVTHEEVIDGELCWCFKRA